jgi:hypothetical protein
VFLVANVDSPTMTGVPQSATPVDVETSAAFTVTACPISGMVYQFSTLLDK